MIVERPVSGTVIPFPSPAGRAGRPGIAVREPEARPLDCYGLGKTPRCLAGFETLCQWCRHLLAGRHA